MLLDAYSKSKELTKYFRNSWREFDSFIFDNLSFMDDCGFVSLDNGNIIGFMSWDPRNMPISVEIGHNCIAENFKGRGKGLEQLRLGLETIVNLKPSKIVVKTGNIEFFKPAQKMYTSVGFIMKSICVKKDSLVLEVVEYELLL